MNKKNILIIIMILILIMSAVFFSLRKNNYNQPDKLIVNIKNAKNINTSLKNPILINSTYLRAKSNENLYITKSNNLICIDKTGKQFEVYQAHEEIGGVCADSVNNVYVGIAKVKLIKELDVVSEVKILKINKNGEVLKTIIPPEGAYQVLKVTKDTIITSNMHGHGLPDNKKKTLSIFLLDLKGKIKKKISIDKFISQATLVWLDKSNNFYFAKQTPELLTVFRIDLNGKLIKKISFKKNKSINENINFIGTDNFGFIYVAIDRPNYKYPTAIVRKYDINGNLIKEIKHKAGLGDQYTITPEGQIFLSQTTQEKTKMKTKLYRIE